MLNEKNLILLHLIGVLKEISPMEMRKNSISTKNQTNSEPHSCPSHQSSTDPRNNPWNFHRKTLRYLSKLNILFLNWPFWLFFKKIDALIIGWEVAGMLHKKFYPFLTCVERGNNNILVTFHQDVILSRGHLHIKKMIVIIIE